MTQSNKKCYLCPICNGQACKGQMPGMGGINNSFNFISNYNDLEKIAASGKIPQEQFASVLAFLDFLNMQNQKNEVKKDSAIINGKNSKEDFFILAGKINLSQEELTDFREKSLI